MVQIVANHLGFFCKKFCCQELLKIAQSGHTGHFQRHPDWSEAGTPKQQKFQHSFGVRKGSPTLEHFVRRPRAT